MLLLPWYSFGRRPRSRSLPYYSHHSRETTYLPTVLRSKIGGLKLTQHCRDFYKRQVKTSAGKPSEDLPLMGREESEVCFQSASRLQTHLFFLYSTFGAEWPCTLNTLFAPQAYRHFGGMPPSMHTIDGVET